MTFHVGNMLFVCQKVDGYGGCSEAFGAILGVVTICGNRKRKKTRKIWSFEIITYNITIELKSLVPYMTLLQIRNAISEVSYFVWQI